MSNNATKNFVNGLNYNKLELIVHQGPAVYSHAKTRLTNKFRTNLNKFTTHDNLISSNILKQPLLNTQIQPLANKRKELFEKKLANLKRNRKLENLNRIKTNRKYLNSERRAALNAIQQIHKNFKRSASTPNELKTGLAKFGVNARKGISNLTRSTGAGLSELRNKSRGFMSMFRRAPQPAPQPQSANNVKWA
jgi:hypothetical protein